MSQVAAGALAFFPTHFIRKQQLDATLQKTLTAVIQAYFDAQTAQAAWVAKQEAVSIAASTVGGHLRTERVEAFTRGRHVGAAIRFSR